MPSGSEWEASDTNWSSWTEISEPEENCEASDGGNSGFRGNGRPCESRTRGFRRAGNRIAAVSPPVPIFALCGKTCGAVCRPAGFGLRKYSIRIMEKLIRLLHEGNYSLVVAHGEIRTFSGRGVSDLYALSGEDPGFLRGASVADKVVGKAAAALMIVAGVSELHADVISRSGPSGRQRSEGRLRRRGPACDQPQRDGLVPAGDPLPRFAYPGGMRGADTRFYECDE